MKLEFGASVHFQYLCLYSDDNTVLWGSWSVIGPNNSFWFGGDTAYSEAFKQIGNIIFIFDRMFFNLMLSILFIYSGP